MARVFIDGFEYGNNLYLYDSTPGYPYGGVVGAITGMSGNYCYSSIGSNNPGLIKNLPDRNEYYFAFKFATTDSYAYQVIYLRYNGTLLAKIMKNTSTNKFEIYRGSTLLATGTIQFASNVVHQIEVHYKPHTTAGIFQVKVDGSMDINFSGNTTPGSIIVNQLGIAGDGSTPGQGWFDDIVVDDAEWPGSTKVQGKTVTGAGSSAQWSPSAGANWQCVDEKPPSETDYVSVNALDQSDLYTGSSLTGTIGSIKSMQFQALVMKEGTPTPQHLKFLIKSGANINEGAALSPPTIAGSNLLEIYNTNPITGNPFTESEIDNFEIGQKAVA